MDLRDMITGRGGARRGGRAPTGDLRSKLGGGRGAARIGRSTGFDLRNMLSARPDDDLIDDLDLVGLDALEDELDYPPRDARLLLSKRRIPIADDLMEDDLDDLPVADARLKLTAKRAGDLATRAIRPNSMRMRIDNEGAVKQLVTQVTRLAASAAPPASRKRLHQLVYDDEMPHTATVVRKRAAIPTIKPTKIIITNDRMKKPVPAAEPPAKKALSSSMQLRMQKKDTTAPVTVLITGLAQSISDTDVQELCETVDGFIKSKMIDKGVAQATFETLAHANELIDQYDGREFDDSEMHMHILGSEDAKTAPKAARAAPAKKTTVTSAPADTSSVDMHDVSEDVDPNDHSLPAQKKRANAESNKKSKINLSNDIILSALHKKTANDDVSFTIKLD